MSIENCAKCGEPLSAEYQNEVTRGLEAIASACGRVINVLPVCDACEVILNRQAKAAAIEQKYLTAHTEGEIPEGLERYRTPPKDLVESNPEPWGMLRGFESVWLHGLTGVGKSSLCRHLLCRVFERGGSVACIPGVAFEQRLTSYAADYEIKRLKHVKALLIDDIDHGQWTARGGAVLRDVLDFRHETQRLTFVTSNAKPEDVCRLFEGFIGKAAAESMLSRMHPYKSFEMVGKSYRKEVMSLKRQPTKDVV